MAPPQRHMAWAADYWKLKKAYAALKEDNLPAASSHFLSCKRTAKLSFNLAVLSLWQTHPKQSIVIYLLDALKKDPYLAIAAFYLGVLERDPKYFDQCLKGFRSCTQIDYTAIGLPFLLDREDVLFNLVSLQSPSADPSALSHLTIQSISSLLLTQLNHYDPSAPLQLRSPPIHNRQMIFNLLPRIEPEPFELKGPEHVSFIQGEDDYFSGFPDAHLRQIKMSVLLTNEFNKQQQ